MRFQQEDFIKTAMPYFKECGADKFDLELITKIIQPRLEVLAEIPEKLDFLTKMPPFDSEMYFHKRMKTDAQRSAACAKRCAGAAGSPSMTIRKSL